MSNYTGRQIAIFTDIHGLYEPTEAIIEDIKRRGITEVYSLGDNVGLGPNPDKVIDLLSSNRVISVKGNSEDYLLFGEQPFISYFTIAKALDNNWTLSKLSEDNIKYIKGLKHSVDLLVGGKRIGLCHFANDIRIDFGSRSTWSYQYNINTEHPYPQRQFYYTNSDEQTKMIDSLKDSNDPRYLGYKDAYEDRLFDGKKVSEYDEIIQGHVHFKLYTEDDNVRIRTIRAAGMAYGADEKDTASYIIIKEKEDGYDIEEVLVKFDRDKMIRSIEESDLPSKEVITKYTR